MMNKFIDILNNLLSEQKRYRFAPETQEMIEKVTEYLWKNRNKKYTRKDKVAAFRFKLANGVDGIVQIVVNPRLKYVGQLVSKPYTSYDPADLVIEVNPKKYESRRNLYLTLYHEMIHASDPTQSHLWNPKYQMSYDETKDEKYWGHPIEFFAISNEFLEGLVLEFQRRRKRLRNVESVEILRKSFDNILNYFAKGEPLNPQSLDILYRINDEYVGEGRIADLVADIKTNYPAVAELINSKKDDSPYYLILIELVKKYNPKIWPRFLTMLYKVKDEIYGLLK